MSRPKREKWMKGCFLAHTCQSRFWSSDPPWPSSLRMTRGQYTTQPCFRFYDLLWPTSLRMVHGLCLSSLFAIHCWKGCSGGRFFAIGVTSVWLCVSVLLCVWIFVVVTRPSLVCPLFFFFFASLVYHYEQKVELHLVMMPKSDIYAKNVLNCYSMVIKTTTQVKCIFMHPSFIVWIRKHEADDQRKIAGNKGFGTCHEHKFFCLFF